MKHAIIGQVAAVLFAACAGLAALAGCAPTGSHGQGYGHGTRTHDAGAGHAGYHGGGSQTGHVRAGAGPDAAMCRQYQDMAAADPAARTAMMERHMPQLSAEQRERHMAMMRERCPQQGGMREAP